MSSQGSIIDRDLDKLAPKFHLAIAQCLEKCHAAGVDAVVYEAYRSNELQQLYYRRGRPPTPEWPHPVTNAPDNTFSWHGYGLAVDIISQKDRWFAPDPKLMLTMTPLVQAAYRSQRAREGERWFALMAQICKECGCDWGGDWSHPDPPHIQYGTLKASPSDRARQLLRQGGMEAVWRAVGAL